MQSLRQLRPAEPPPRLHLGDAPLSDALAAGTIEADEGSGSEAFGGQAQLGNCARRRGATRGCPLVTQLGWVNEICPLAPFSMQLVATIPRPHYGPSAPWPCRYEVCKARLGSAKSFPRGPWDIVCIAARRLE